MNNVEQKLTNLEILENKGFEDSEDFPSEKYELQSKITERIVQQNQQLSKEDSCLVKPLKELENKLDEERVFKRFSLEQYGKTEIVE